MVRIYITSQSRYPVNSKEIKKRVGSLLGENKVTDGNLSIWLVGERKMRDLGKRFLNEGEDDATHEVLSFPTNDINGEFSKIVNIKGFTDPEDSLNLGDIAICYPEARKIAIRRNRMMDDVIGELAEHGTLHLLGVHHH